MLTEKETFLLRSKWMGSLIEDRELKEGVVGAFKTLLSKEGG